MTQLPGEEAKSNNTPLKLSNITYFAPKRDEKNNACRTTTERRKKQHNVHEIHASHLICIKFDQAGGRKLGCCHTINCLVLAPSPPFWGGAGALAID
jgi:hypothetical protein